ncbi:ribose-5-phosphate isomerase RpiA [Bacillus sp. RG28]|uniref:Ribose-5-phosphate isomerase A n=1 Tax=Gottfriedia endophytica TaxID=2820819 RepID=A0A940SJQ1_9BACI|nr:ribose-5-phosphate isomerase RpiA [Gottfriedia endophytica]MBP0725701.1 ribose-5-phosphate isomerase RpiA [Gottfriedia endophytica]
MNEKQIVGEKAAEYVKDGMIVGLGTGSTVFYTIKKLGEMVNQGLSIKGIPTSIQTETLARELKIPLVNFSEVDCIDVAIDGADEIDSDLNLIKGGGGALLREKIIAKAANTFIVVADSTKIVESLGSFPLPVEVVPFGYEMTKKQIIQLGIEPTLRQVNNHPYKTDNGNYIFDCEISSIFHASELEKGLNMIPGVVENGLFVKMVDAVITLDSKKDIVIKKIN